MKCILTKATAAFLEFNFTETDNTDVHICYSKEFKTVKLSSDEELAFFYLEQNLSILKTNISFKDGYGKKHGALSIHHMKDELQLKLDDEMYNCKIVDGKILVYRQHHAQIVYTLTVNFGEEVKQYLLSGLNEAAAAVLLAACWMVKQAVMEQQHLQYN